jgi:hypothetical protein
MNVSPIRMICLLKFALIIFLFVLILNLNTKIYKILIYVNIHNIDNIELFAILYLIIR